MIVEIIQEVVSSTPILLSTVAKKRWKPYLLRFSALRGVAFGNISEEECYLFSKYCPTSILRLERNLKSEKESAESYCLAQPTISLVTVIGWSLEVFTSARVNLSFGKLIDASLASQNRNNARKIVARPFYWFLGSNCRRKCECPFVHHLTDCTHASACRCFRRALGNSCGNVFVPRIRRPRDGRFLSPNVRRFSPSEQFWP